MRDPADQLLPLVEKLYDAAGGQTGWDGFLGSVATTLRAVIPGLFVHDRPAESATLAVTVDMDPTWGEAYDSYYVKHDLRRRKIWTLPQGGIFVGNMLVPDDELVRWIAHGRRFARRQSYTKWIMTGQAGSAYPPPRHLTGEPPWDYSNGGSSWTLTAGAGRCSPSAG